MSTAPLHGLIQAAIAQPDHDRARAQLDDFVSQLKPFPLEVAQCLYNMADDLLAYTAL